MKVEVETVLASPNLATLASLVRSIKGPLGDKAGLALDALVEELTAHFAVVEERSAAQADAVVNAATLMAELHGAYEELDRAHDAAKAASEAKSQFVANMSHEIRTPMNGVLGMAELLSTTALDERQKRFVGAIQRSGTALLTIINDILDFSKIESGKLELQCSAFDIREVVADVAELLSNEAHQTGIEIAVSVTNAVPDRVHGDPHRLRQVLLNLMGNGIKFTDAGEVVVSVSVVSDDSDTALLQFSVRDTGIGISREVQESIFDAFRQADASTSRRHGGTGLGLAVSKPIVRMMGGELQVTSTLGAGSEFSFTVPFRVAAAPESDRGSATNELHGLKVLIVDDNATNLDILEHQALGWGMRPDPVLSGEDAIRLLSKANASDQRFDLAIIDLHMPEMDGLELAKSIRECPPTSRLPLLLLSSVSRDERDEASIADLVDIRVDKPVRERELFATLVSLWTHRRDRLEEEDGTVHLAGATHQGPSDVLLLEDNIVDRAVTVAMLEAVGCRVSVVDKDSEVRSEMRHCSFGLVFIEFRIQADPRVELTKQLRQQEREVAEPLLNGRNARVPIIALTDHAMPEDRDEYLNAGIDAFLRKPFTQRELKELVRRWISPTDPVRK